MDHWILPTYHAPSALGSKTWVFVRFETRCVVVGGQHTKLLRWFPPVYKLGLQDMFWMILQELHTVRNTEYLDGS